MEQHIQTFDAVDKNGTPYTLEVWQEVIPAGTRADPDATVAGLKQLRTSDGLSVSRKSKGVYEIVQTGTILTSDAPDAP